MKISRLFAGLVAGSAIVAAATVAQADGMERGRATYDRPASWSGVYVGVHSGWYWADYDNTYVNNGGNWSVNPSNAIYGGQIGLQHQFGNLVAGIEGGYSSPFKNDGDQTQCPNPATRCQAELEDVLTIGARLGWAAGTWMPYLTGGYANARFTDRVTSAATGAVNVVGSERHGGWYIGGGIDWAIARDWTIGIEYRHYDFGDEFYNRHNGLGTPVLGDNGTVSANLDTVTFRASWKFSRDTYEALK